LRHIRICGIGLVVSPAPSSDCESNISGEAPQVVVRVRISLLRPRSLVGTVVRATRNHVLQCDKVLPTDWAGSR
jgi:hypothetical protein